MRKAIFIFLTFALPLLLSGQSAEDRVSRLKGSGNPGDATVEPGEDNPAGRIQAEEKSAGSWDLSVGSSFLYMPGYGSGMMLYAVPSYTMPLTSRWTLHGGLMASQYSGIAQGLSAEAVMPGTFSSLAIFGAASYRMNERLVIHGTGVKSLLSAPVTPLTIYPADRLSVGATYRLGDNITIGATINMSKRSGFYSSPFGGHSLHPPFYW